MPLTWGFCAWRSVPGLRGPADVVLACVDHDSESLRGGRDSAELRAGSRSVCPFCEILVRRGSLGLGSIGHAFYWRWSRALPRLCARDELPAVPGRSYWRVVLDFVAFSNID